MIVEGYAVWELAKLQSRAALTCIVRHMDHETALLHLLDKNRGSKGIGDFARILMALELEPWFSDRAKCNQRTGGREKGSTRLAEADRLDVRIEVARAAGVSAGNVSKAKHILQSGIPDLQAALLAGEISMNRAAAWVRDPRFLQTRHLSELRERHGMRRTIDLFLRKHHASHPNICEGLRDVQRGLQKLHSDTTLSSLKAALCVVIQQIDGLLYREKSSRAA